MEDDIIKHKTEFAKMMLQNIAPLRAATTIFTRDMKTALRVSREWPEDVDVLRIKQELVANNEAFLLPDKASLALAVWNKMQSDGVDADDYAKLARLYADLHGYIEKQKEAPVVNNTIILPRAIEVPTYINDDEWAAEAERQQAELLGHSRTRN